MSVQNTVLSLLVLSALGFVISFFFLKVYECGASVFCYNLHTNTFAFYYGTGALSLVFLTLLVVPHAFSAWKKFAIWFVPFAVLLFVLYPEPGSGNLFSPSPEQIFQWVSALYVIISLVIIGWSVWKR